MIDMEPDYKRDFWREGIMTMIKKYSIILTLTVIITTGLPLAASADYFASPPQGGSAMIYVGKVTFGMEFLVGNTSLIVNRLGVYDEGGDGLATAHTVRIYQDGVIKVSVDIPSGTEAAFDLRSLDGGWRWMPLNSPLTLTANTKYVIAAFYPSYINNFNVISNDIIRDRATINGAFTITNVLNSRGLEETEMVLPTRNSKCFSPDVQGWFGPNMSYTPAPIPAAIWLLGSGLLGLFGLKRKFIQFTETVSVIVDDDPSKAPDKGLRKIFPKT